MLMKKRILYTFSIYAAVLAVVFAQDGGVSVESSVDRNQILIGDVITYSVIVSHAKDVELQMPSLAANLGAFEIRDYKVLDPVKRDDKIVEQTNYLISTFDTGEYEIPELPVQYRLSGDSTWRTIKTEPILISVSSLNPDSTGDIRDIKPPMTPPRDYRAMIKWMLIALLSLALLAFILYYIKRRREGKSLLPKRAQPPRPAHEIALEALNELVQSDLLAGGDVKEYYTRLSDIIRQYIENRYFINALEMTTTQLLGAMRQAGLEDLVETMNDFLSTCDLVKFAAFIPDEETHRQKTKTAFDFVNKTKLIIVETPAGEGEASALEEEAADVVKRDGANDGEERDV